MNWKDNFKEGKEIILATSSKIGIPNANIVVSLGFIDNKLLVADCQMNNTNKNLKENPNICVIGGYFRVKGKVEIFLSGEYFDMCVQKSNGYDVKSAILINIVEIFNLDKGEKIEK
jgi:predicted pyridoxine 5'-phosphate oxidase superfamily flavin-nucleotide-binding protein